MASAKEKLGPLAAQWEKLSRSTTIRTIPPKHRELFRTVFYAGSIAVISALDNAIEEGASDEEGGALVKAMTTELAEFGAELRRSMDN